jgi:hypothetical protein
LRHSLFRTSRISFTTRLAEAMSSGRTVR